MRKTYRSEDPVRGWTRRRTQHCLTMVCVALLLCSGCNTLDERDICCEEVTLLYRYVRTNQDEYLRFIQQERHFLFDSEGRFVKEVPANPKDRQRLTLKQLVAGEYTMVTIGNATEGYTAISSLQKGVSHLRDLEVALQRQVEGGGAFAASEELFWNSRTFRAEEGKRHSYICDMANIHCHLHLKVSWEGVPPEGSPDFQFELTYLTPAYTMTVVPEYNLKVAGRQPEDGLYSTPSFVLHQFPYFKLPPSATVQVTQSLRGHELYPTITTLRYLNDRIPTLQIVHLGQKLFDVPIDLTPIFHDWGWYPNRDHEQIYRIELYIRRDGKVEVRQWVSASVLDWQDGGTFG